VTSALTVLWLCATSLLYARGARELRSRGKSALRRWEALSFAAGQSALAAALLSPLDRLKDVLFSAHMGQHELLMLVAAPLLVLGRPLLVALWGFPDSARRRIAGVSRVLVPAWSALTHPFVAVLVHGVTLWVWHVPALYQACLHSAALHAFQHFTFFVTAALFWWAMAHGRFGSVGYGLGVLFVFVTATHSALLGVLLTFAQSLWYPDYAAPARRMAIDALQDQQLAGLLMWVPAGAIFTLVGVALFAAWLGQAERRAALGTVALASRGERRP
jgi:putative membrane protein